MSMRYPGGLIATSPVNARYPSGVWTQAQAAPYQAQNVWTRDQFWPNTTLLLQGDGATNGAQNNTFLDSSSNNFTITRNGNTTQGAFTPYEQDGYWSNFFDGTGDWLQTPANAALAMGTGNFTWECFAYFTQASAWGSLFDSRSGNTSDGFYVGFDSGGTSLLVRTSSNIIVSSALPVINSWQHICLVRSGTTLSLYINGVRTGTTTNSTDLSNNVFRIFGPGDPAFGYCSNARVVKGTAVYDPTQSTLTVPTGPLTAITNTSLLTCQSNRFRDSSTNNFTLTANGNTSVQAFQPFPGATTWSGTVLSGSGYFDGTGDYLTLPVNSAFDLGLNACCVEAWVYLTNNNEMALFSTSANVNGQTRPNFYVKFNQIQLDFFNNVVIQANITVPLNAWNHVAFTRASSSGPWRVFLNGVLQAYNATGSQNLLQTGAAQDVNRLYGGTTGQGYMCDLRIVNGSVPSAYVTSSTTIGATIFTPPTTPLTAITNTSLLLSYINAGIYDNSMMNNLETVGNAQVSTSVVKYGTGSMAFDGSGDYLFAANNPGQRIMGGDFTVEMWMYLGAAQANMGLVSSYENNNGWIVRLDTTYIRFFYGISGSGTANDVTYSFSPGVWYHIAWVKLGTSLRCYINGTQQGSTFTVSGAVDTTTAGMQVGRTQTTSNDFNGYIDDLRVTKGAARYITNFTPPIARLPAQ